MLLRLNKLNRLHLLLLALLLALAALFILAFMQEKMGNFTINLNRLEMYRKGISIAADGDFTEATARLVAEAVVDATNISGSELPEDIDDIDGNHNGKNYMAYTYYIRNAGKEDVSYYARIRMDSCAKGAEFAYNFGNAVRYESVEGAREMDDKTIRAWSAHPNLHIIDNSVDFEDKMTRGLRAVYECLGEKAPEQHWHKYLIDLPDLHALETRYAAAGVDMMQTYLTRANPNIVRRVRQQKNGGDYLYFYTEKRTTGSGQWETEKPISEKEYIRYLMEGDTSLHTVHKTKYRFVYNGCRFEIDVYPFSQDRAIMRAALPENAPVLTAPPEITVLREVTGDPAYKNRQLAKNQRL